VLPNLPYNNVSELLGLLIHTGCELHRSHGKYTRTFLLKYTKMPALLVSHGFEAPSPSCPAATQASLGSPTRTSTAGGSTRRSGKPRSHKCLHTRVYAARHSLGTRRVASGNACTAVITSTIIASAANKSLRTACLEATSTRGSVPQLIQTARMQPRLETLVATHGQTKPPISPCLTLLPCTIVLPEAGAWYGSTAW
jgi:hypothetical protein